VKEITVEINEGGNNSVQIMGRCLGLITAAQFEGIMRLSGIESKLFTVPTTPLTDLIERDDLAGLRLAVAMKEKDGEPFLTKRIFITAPIDYISSYIGDASEMEIMGQGSYYTLSETEKSAKA
jgi:hypothetical protein